MPMPAYEGFHQMRNGNYWLGLFRRQYVFSLYKRLSATPAEPVFEPDVPVATPKRLVPECPHCLSRYDARFGEPHRGILASTPFDALTADYVCGLREAWKVEFVETWLA